MNTLKIKKMHPDAIVPKYAHAGDSGFDFVAMEDVLILPGQTVKIPTGLAFELPPGWEIQVRDRSGVASKTKLRVANAPGTVDSSYRGEVLVIMENINCPHVSRFSNYAMLIDNKNKWAVDDDTPYGGYYIRKGDRIAQGVVAPVIYIDQFEFEEVDELEETERGEDGFGSTGVN